VGGWLLKPPFEAAFYCFEGVLLFDILLGRPSALFPIATVSPPACRGENRDLLAFGNKPQQSR
jgi:hypothetical protein